MLTNDNFIRLIDIHDPDISLQKVALGVAEDGINDFGVSIYARELGESAVSFDIGPPIHRNSNDHNRSSQALETMADIEQVYWPIYVLKGNGDILLVYTSLHNVYVSKKIYGPLKMYPSAEDNYGVDACSLIVIKSSPSLIVIGTSTGMLHHCIAMPQDEECSTYSFLPQINLYVYESIELTLSLTAAIEIDNPLKLIKSDLNTECYFCLHHSGVHVIKIPFLRQILEDRFTQEPAMETIVEHLICTRPIANSAGDQNDDQVSFPIGVTLAVRSTFLLFILLSDGKMFTQRLAPIDYEFQNATIPTKQEATEGDSSKLNESKIHHLKPVEFNEYVRKLLQRKHSAPLISTPAGQKEPNSKESFQFLLNLTQTFRNDYLVKLDAVQELIASRAKSLQTTKEWQQNEVQSLDAKLAGFINEGQRVNGKYAVTLEKQKEISQRLSKLIDKALHNYKHPTKAELEQAQQVEQISKEMQAYREKMLEIERKFNYYEKIYRNKTSKASELIRNTNRSPDWQNVQRVLNQQTEQIAELLQHLNKIKQQVN